jgi:hypothetical protein
MAVFGCSHFENNAMEKILATSSPYSNYTSFGDIYNDQENYA